MFSPFMQLCSSEACLIVKFSLHLNCEAGATTGLAALLGLLDDLC